MRLKTRHIPFAQLVDLVDGRVATHVAAKLRAHITLCPHCTRERHRLTHTLNLLQTDTSEDAPPAVITRALALLRPVHPIMEVLQRIWATLRFDSAQMTPALGLRSGQAQARQLLFQADDLDLDLRVTPSGSGWAVSGQVLGPTTAGLVELQGSTATTDTLLDDLGEFTLPSVPPGVYTLVLRFPSREVGIAALDIGA